MPRSFFARYYRKQLKVMVVEGVVFLSAFVIIAHLSVGFWDRYFIQNELSSMKANLYSMKDTINQINMNYDNLNKELESIVDDATPKLAAIAYPYVGETVKYKRNLKYGKIVQKDGRIQAMVAANADMIGLMKDSSVLNKPLAVDRCTMIHKNATTLTKYPLKSEGAGSFFVKDLEEEFKQAKCIEEKCCGYIHKYRQ